MIHFLEFVSIIVAVVVVWNRLHPRHTEPSQIVAPSPERPSPGRSSADDAYSLGVGVGLKGGTIEGAVIAQYALRAVEEKTGHKADARTVGTVLGLHNSPGGSS